MTAPLSGGGKRGEKRESGAKKRKKNGDGVNMEDVRMYSEEEIRERIMKILSSVDGPLATSEIAQMIGMNRRVTLRALQKLAIEGKIKGRRAKVAKGLWLWWVE